MGIRKHPSSHTASLTVLGRIAADQLFEIMVEGGHRRVSALIDNVVDSVVGRPQKITGAVDLHVADVSRVGNPHHGVECP